MPNLNGNFKCTPNFNSKTHSKSPQKTQKPFIHRQQIYIITCAWMLDIAASIRQRNVGYTYNHLSLDGAFRKLWCKRRDMNLDILRGLCAAELGPSLQRVGVVVAKSWRWLERSLKFKGGQNLIDISAFKTVVVIGDYLWVNFYDLNTCWFKTRFAEMLTFLIFF